MSLEIGVNYERRLNKRLSLRLGMGMKQLTNVLAEKEYRAEMPTFGSAYRSTIISAHRLYVLDIPAALVVHLSNRHSLLVGVGMDYIVQTHNQISEKEVTSFGERLIGASSDRGYLAGVTPVIYNASLGYCYRITGRLSTGLFMTSGGVLQSESSVAYRSRLNVRLNWRLL
jgi:hypothetical protein